MLINRLIDHFPRGQIAFDAMSSFALSSGNSKLKNTSGAVLKWAVDDVSTVDDMDIRLKRLDVVSLFKIAVHQDAPLRSPNALWGSSLFCEVQEHDTPATL